MTESDELKKNIEQEKLKQMVDRMSLYLDELSETIQEAKRLHDKSKIIYLIAWLAWVASSILSREFYQIFTLIFIFALIYDQFRYSQMMGAVKEFRGAVKTLEILGYIRPREDDGETSTKKRFWEKGADLVKSWTAKKKKVQDKVFSPA